MRADLVTQALNRAPTKHLRSICGHPRGRAGRPTKWVTRAFRVREVEAVTDSRVLAETAVGRAVRSIAAHGREATLVDVVNGRILRLHADAIERYLVLRIGDRDRARLALRELRATVATASADEFVAPPSVRAHLYRIARSIAMRHRSELPADWSTTRSIPWALGRDGGPEFAGLDAVRSGLADSSLEILELRLVRGLSLDEIALVLAIPADAMPPAYDAAADAASRVLGTQDGDRVRLPFLVGEALSLELGRDERRAPGTMGLDQGDDQFAPLPAGTVLGGRYTLDKRVGAGAFGEVYRASDTEVPGHVVALKLLHQPSMSDPSRAAALRELHLIASVFHPSIVQFKDHGWHENRLWFVMPWYQGESLETRMRRAPLSRAEAHRIFKSLARALTAMHTAGIRHQDVKPDNVYLAKIRTAADDDVLPVLLDLGVAAKEAEMIVAGTPTYFAPEVAAQFANVDNRPAIGVKADVFSLALTLRNALDPANEESIGESVEVFIARRAICAPPPPRSPDLNYLAPHFARWLELDPSKRPDAETFANQLDVLLEPETRRERRRAQRAAIIPLTVVALSVLLVVGFFIAQKVTDDRLAVANARHQAAALSAELDMTRSDKSRTDQALGHVQSQLQQGRLTQSDLERTVRLVGASLDNAVARVDAMKTRAEIAERDLATVTTRLTAADALTTRETSRANRGEADVAARNADLERERASLADLRARFDRSVADLERARTELERSRTALAGLEADVSAATARATSAERRIEDATTRANRAEQDADEARARMRQLEREVERLRASPATASAAPAAAPAPAPP